MISRSDIRKSMIIYDECVYNLTILFVYNI